MALSKWQRSRMEEYNNKNPHAEMKNNRKLWKLKRHNARFNTITFIVWSWFLEMWCSLRKASQHVRLCSLLLLIFFSLHLSLSLFCLCMWIFSLDAIWVCIFMLISTWILPGFYIHLHIVQQRVNRKSEMAR